MRSGSSARTTATAKAPRTRPRAARTASASAAPGGHVVLDQVGQDLGVGLRDQLWPGATSSVGQLGVVLDDPVVHQGQAAGAVEVGVGVGLGGVAVGGPAGVADAGASPRRGASAAIWRSSSTERVPSAARARQRPPPSADQGHAGRVVAPVLETVQALEQDRQRVVARRWPR